MAKTSFLTGRSALISTLAISALALTAVSYATSSSIAQDKQPPPGKHEKKGGDEKESPLEQAMQMMQGAQKRLDKALEKKDLAGVLALVVDMEKAAQAAKVETPPKADEISDPKKKAEFVAGFRKELISLQKALCDLEVAAIDGKPDDATRIYESVIKPMKKDGHAKYKGD